MTQARREPYLDEGMEGFIRNTAIKEFWRVADWYSDPADLIQDGYLCFAKCRARYVYQLGTLPAINPTKEHRKWMMALVRTAFWRHIKFTIAGKMRWGHEEPVSQLVRPGADAPEDPWEGLTPPVSGDDSCIALLRSLPSELQELIVLLVGDRTEFYRGCLERRQLPLGGTRMVRRGGKRPLRETTNQHYCRLLGLDPRKHDLVGQIRALLVP